ncbi:MAG: hypothetical protein AB1489_15455 [Acidobacteriota bacterium]
MEIVGLVGLIALLTLAITALFPWLRARMRANPPVSTPIAPISEELAEAGPAHIGLLSRQSLATGTPPRLARQPCFSPLASAFVVSAMPAGMFVPEDFQTIDPAKLQALQAQLEQLQPLSLSIVAFSQMLSLETYGSLNQLQGETARNIEYQARRICDSLKEILS